MTPRVVQLYQSEGLGSETERAWAAGFFDGEGSMHLYNDKRPNRRRGLILQISQADERPMLRFKRVTGYLGKVNVEPKPRGPNRKLLYVIYTSNSGALFVLNAIWEWLSEPKREQYFRVMKQVDQKRYPGPTPYELAVRRARRLADENAS